MLSSGYQLAATRNNPPTGQLQTTRLASQLPADTVLSRWIFPDGTIVSHDQIVGVGSDGLILRLNKTQILKIPHFSETSTNGTDWKRDLPDLAGKQELLSNEVKAYKRLANVPGIAQYHGMESGGLVIEYYPNSSLESHVLDLTEKSLQCRISWMSQAIVIVHDCHRAGILLFDIALRNFVLTATKELRAIDFTQAAVVSTSIDIDTADEEGLTTRVDMFHLGCVLYSIAASTKLQVECDTEAARPQERDLPSTVGLPLGTLIQGCWDMRYTSTKQLLGELHSRRQRRRQKLRRTRYNDTFTAPSTTNTDDRD